MFARELGVTALTVYRWELPDGAPEARRPRGKLLERVRRLLGVDGGRARGKDADVWAAFMAVFGLEWRKGQGELLRVAGGQGADPDAVALAGAGLAFVEVAHYSRARTAFAALAPALRVADEGGLSPAVEAHVQAVGALVAAIPDSELFDVGRVHARAERVASLAAHAPEARVVAELATLAAAFCAGGQELLTRALGRIADLEADSLPVHLDLTVAELRAVEALLLGQPLLAAERFEHLRARADACGFVPLAARAMANLAVRRLDDLGDPGAALELARSSKALAARAGLGPGLHAVFALRAETEALVRLGRLDEARAAIDEIDRYSRDVSPPPFVAVPTYARYCFLSGEIDRLATLRGALSAVRSEELRATADACAAYTDALAAVAHGDGGARAYAKFQEAESRAAGWWTLLREIVVFSIPAAAVSDVPGAGREQLRRAYRFLDRYPSPWALAQTRRFDGIVTALEGRPDEGRRLLEASIATFELASDVPDALMSRLMLHAIERGLGEAGAVEGLSEARAALARIGVRPPEMLEQNQERLALALASRAPRARAASEVGLVERLEGLVERVASRGTSAPLLEREVGSVVRALLAGREVRIERRGAEVRADCTWFEVPDGAGGELLVGVEGEVDDATRAALTILAAVAGLALENATLRGLGRAPAAGPTESASFVAASAAMKKLSSEIARMAQSRATVVIHGESGSGKEVVARAIHARSSRAGAELVAFNCAAVPRELFEGQLFGYKRGAFTGAVKDSPGVVRAAAGGTLFLDEIGELPPEVQPKLLRFLENGEVLPLGEERPVVVDVRVIAATHRDLFALVREGRFREDLYYRLQVVPLRVPPLRERREDVLPLARHFMGQLVPDGASPPVLAPDAVAALEAHRWPGNVRELRNVIERALAFAPLPRVLHREHVRV